MTDSCSTRAPPPITHIDLLAKDRAENAKAPPAGKSSCPQRHFCSAVELRSRAKAHKAAKPPDFAQGKIPSILNHEAKMLACKGISARPSNVTSCGATRRTGGGTPPILAIRQVLGNIIPRSENACLQGHFCSAVECHIVRRSASHGRQHAADTCHSASIM